MGGGGGAIAEAMAPRRIAQQEINLGRDAAIPTSVVIRTDRGHGYGYGYGWGYE